MNNNAKRLPRYVRWGLSALPLVLVTALALTFAWGHEGAGPAQAVTGPEMSIEIKGGTTKPANPGQLTPPVGCSTKNPPGTTNCSVPLGSRFTVSVHINSIAGLPNKDGDGKAGYRGFQARLNYTAGLTLKNRPGTAEIVWPECVGPSTLPAEAKDWLKPLSYVGLCLRDPAVLNESVFLGRVMEVDFNCVTEGKQAVTLKSEPPPDINTTLVDENDFAVMVNGGVNRSIVVDCQVPPAEININVVDAKIPTLKLGGTCWQVFYIDQFGFQVQHDVVGDNGKFCAGSVGKLSDSDPAAGRLRIPIPSDQLRAFGSIWHAVMIQAPTKYLADPTKHVCDLDLGKCDRVARVQATSGDLTITVVENSPLHPAGVDGICFDIATQTGGVNDPPFKRVCTNAQGQVGPQNLPFGTYSVEIDLATIREFFNFDDKGGTQPAKQKCVLSNDPTRRVCNLAYSIRHKDLGQINITKQDGVLLVLLPNSCYLVGDQLNNPLFRVCDNDFQGPPVPHPVCVPDGICNDEDPTGGLIRATVTLGVYSVQESKPPPGYNIDPRKQFCEADFLVKCELFFFDVRKKTSAEMSVLVDTAPDKRCKGQKRVNPTIFDGGNREIGQLIDVCVAINAVSTPYSGWEFILEYNDDSWRVKQAQGIGIFGTCDFITGPFKKELQGDLLPGQVAVRCQNSPGTPLKTALGPVAVITFQMKKKGNLEPEKQIFHLVPKGVKVQGGVTGSSVFCQPVPEVKINCDNMTLIDGGIWVLPQPPKITIPLSFLIVFNTPANSPWTAQNIRNQLAHVNKIWSQANINFTWTNDPIFHPVNDPQKGPGQDGDVKAAGKDSKLDPEFWQVCDAMRAERNRIKPGTFPVGLIRYFVDGVPHSPTYGQPQLANWGITCVKPGRIHAGDKNNPFDNQLPTGVGVILSYANKVPGEHGMKFGETLAHELGHVLCLGHIVEEPHTGGEVQNKTWDEQNLMHPKAVTQQKLTQKQIEIARRCAAEVLAQLGQPPPAKTSAEMSVLVDTTIDKSCQGEKDINPKIEDGAGVPIDVCVAINAVSPSYHGWQAVIWYNDDSWRFDQTQGVTTFGTCDQFAGSKKVEVQGDGLPGYVFIQCQNSLTRPPKTQLGPVMHMRFISKKKANALPTKQMFRLVRKHEDPQGRGGSTVFCASHVYQVQQPDQSFAPAVLKKGCDNMTLVDGGIWINPQFDKDWDGCTDVRESGPNPNLGGARNPNNHWDFFDTPSATGAKDRVVDIVDIVGAVVHFGSIRPGGPPTKAEALAEEMALKGAPPPPPPAYDIRFDRTFKGPNAWNTGPPDGTIDIFEITAAVTQFGHSCV